jgi:ribosomal silencing factor RsfS
MSSKDSLLSESNIIASVRSKEQVDALQASGANAIRLDLSDETSVVETIIRHKGNNNLSMLL